jgi:hypothetical protein
MPRWERVSGVYKSTAKKSNSVRYIYYVHTATTLKLYQSMVVLKESYCILYCTVFAHAKAQKVQVYNVQNITKQNAEQNRECVKGRDQ